jgi:3-oxoacyl-[acyl-carrier protein] reductase
MNLGLKNKVALVTGGYRGLGRAICLNLAAEGAKVAVNYRKNKEKADLLVSEMRDKLKAEAVAVYGDVTIEEDVKRIFKEVEGRFSRLDILVNNSGICPVSMVQNMELSEWESVIRTNLTGTFLTCREMVNFLIKRNMPGKIVNIASQSAFNGSASGKSHYSASKGGVVSFTGSLAKEVASYGINVNAVAPGMLYTEMTAETLDKNMDKYKEKIPIGRIAEVDEVARIVVFLASEASSYITGATIDASGGMIGAL